MEKPILQEKDHSGQESKIYKYRDSKIIVYPSFLYEIKVYKYWNEGFCILGSRYITSDKLLSIKYYNCVKYYNGYTTEQEISLIGAPLDFIESNNCSEYTPVTKHKKKNKNEKSR